MQVYNYNGVDIPFDTEKGVLINATEMAKPFGEKKAPKWFLRNAKTKEFIEVLTKVRKSTFTDLLIVRKGSSKLGGGTWMQEDLALYYAQWLSPEFHIWCNDRIKEILTQGYSVLTSETVRKLRAQTGGLTRALNAVKADKVELEIRLEKARDFHKEHTRKLREYFKHIENQHKEIDRLKHKLTVIDTVIKQEN